MRQIASVVVFILFALFGLPFLLQKGWVPLPSHGATSYWIGIFTYVVIYSLLTLGLGLLIGRVGMVSLCQFMLLLVGSWIAVRFDQLWPWLPYPAVLLIAGIVTGAIGTLIGLPALRLSGLYLALITLMAAGAITVLLKVQQFPNGGGGFWGVKKGSPISAISRPSIALGDTAFYRYCVCVAILMFLIAFWHVKTKPGRAWAAIRQSEATALSAGVRTTVYKLWAFALAAFFAGVAGGMLASPPGVNINQLQDTGLDRDLRRSLSSAACTRWRGRSSVASCSGSCPHSSSSGASASSGSRSFRESASCKCFSPPPAASRSRCRTTSATSARSCTARSPERTRRRRPRSRHRRRPRCPP